jgi:hypothetical protein
MWLPGLAVSAHVRYNRTVIVPCVWTVQWHLEAEQELQGLPPAERVALLRAVQKLEALGPRLPFPHQSAVRAGGGLRELRPRGGRSPWRALYRRSEDSFVIVAVSPEAQVDRRGFERAIATAHRRWGSE